MKSTSSVVVVSLVLCCASLACAARLDRSLKQAPSPTTNSVSVTASSSCTANNGNCNSVVSVSSQAIDDAASSISLALSTAIAQADGNADVDASSFAFAQAISNAYARIISRYVVDLSASPGSTACASGFTYGTATASAISQATSRAFAQSSNAVAQAGASCFSNAVSSAALTVTQRSSRQICVTDGEFSIRETLETIGFVQTVATAFSNVFTAIRNNNASADAICGSAGTSFRSTTNTGTSG